MRLLHAAFLPTLKVTFILGNGLAGGGTACDCSCSRNVRVCESNGAEGSWCCCLKQAQGLHKWQARSCNVVEIGWKCCGVGDCCDCCCCCRKSKDGLGWVQWAES